MARRVRQNANTRLVLVNLPMSVAQVDERKVPHESGVILRTAFHRLVERGIFDLIATNPSRPESATG